MRWLNLVLVLAILIGGYQAIRAGRKHQKLLRIQHDLAVRVGELPVDDPQRVHVIALETDDPLHFAWRIHLPADYAPVWETKSGFGSESSSSGGSDEAARSVVVRVRFRKVSGQWVAWFKVPNGSHLFGSLPAEIVSLFESPDNLPFRQTGRDGPQSFATGEQIELLHIAPPDEAGTATGNNDRTRGLVYQINPRQPQPQVTPLPKPQVTPQ